MAFAPAQTTTSWAAAQFGQISGNIKGRIPVHAANPAGGKDADTCQPGSDQRTGHRVPPFSRPRQRNAKITPADLARAVLVCQAFQFFRAETDMYSAIHQTYSCRRSRLLTNFVLHGPRQLEVFSASAAHG